jgi:gliding motility-associated-like protein
MKTLLYVSFFVSGLYGHAQTALYNQGNLRIHQNGAIGFHTDLINDGAFDQNVGLAGFYGNLLDVSGAFAATLFDVEIMTQSGVSLSTSLNTLNNANFISGNVLTVRAQPDLNLNFLQNGFSSGESDLSKVDGYASVTDQQNFTFPVGDTAQLRPLILNSSGANALAKCAYFLEDPNSPSTFATSFDTNRKPASVGQISTVEFWRLEGNVNSTISISWNGRSNIGNLTADLNDIVAVGWSKSANQWVSLGGSSTGDLTQGFAMTASFVPDEYEIITFGAAGIPTEIVTLDNYLVTANGDGINDVLEFPELELSPNNHLKIYNRYGLKVFDMQNYTNEFNGFSNVNNLVITRNKGLPDGVYFYIIAMKDLGLDFQGFLYLTH